MRMCADLQISSHLLLRIKEDELSIAAESGIFLVMVLHARAID